MKKFILLILLQNILICSQVQLLSLVDCIEIAREQSPAAQIARHQYDADYWSYQSYSAGLKPQVSLWGSAPELNRSISSIPQDDGSFAFHTQNQAFSRFNISVSQTIIPTGGSIYISSNILRVDEFEGDHSYYWQASPFVIGFSQPLFQFNSEHWNRKIETLRFEETKRRYLENMEEIAIDVTRKFFNYYIARILLENAEFNTAVNDTIYKISHGRFTVGKIAENDLLRTELALMNSQNSKERAKLDFQQAYENLKLTLGYSETDTFSIILPENIGEVELNPELVLAQARDNRSEYISYEIQELEAEQSVKQAKSDRWFDADLNASLGYNQTADNLTDLYKDPLDRETLTLSFNIPLFQKQYQANEEQALSNREKNQWSVKESRLNFEQHLKYQVKEFQLLKKQLVLAARSDTIAALQFKVAKERYLIGKTDITSLFTAQNEKDSASRQYYQLLMNYWVAYYQLQKLALYDFIIGQKIKFRL